MSRPFIQIDFDVYDDFSGNMDDVVKCLNVIRKKFCETPDLYAHGLRAHLILTNRKGETVPTIGVYHPKSKYFGYFDTGSLTSVYEDWARTGNHQDLAEECAKYGVPNWQELQASECYPPDERDLY